MHGSRPTLGVLVLFLFVVWVSGCSRKPVSTENPAADHLRKIAQAFDIAVYKTGHAPRNAEELKLFLKDLAPEEDPDALLRSPNDGQPYEVAWGVNLERQTDYGALFAHEKNGSGGKRYVLTVMCITQQMTDAEFSRATYLGARRPAAAR